MTARVTVRLQKKSAPPPTIALVMLAFLGNLGLLELVLILVIAVLIFGKDLPQAASKAYLQARKLRNAVDDLRRESGIDRELREIERNVREAEWEARKPVAPNPPPTERRPPTPLPPAAPPPPPAESTAGGAPTEDADSERPSVEADPLADDEPPRA
jgi:Sec-independent protein translocase protein TatA